MAGKLVASVPLVASGRGWEVRRDTEHLIVNLLPPLVWTNIGMSKQRGACRLGPFPRNVGNHVDALDSAFAAVFA